MKLIFIVFITISTFTHALTTANDVIATENGVVGNNNDEMMPEIEESDLVAAALAEKLDREKLSENSFSFPAFLRFNRINKSGNNVAGRIPVCFCCRAFVCHHQRCPCSKFIF